MQVRFWGARGSIPVSGPVYDRYGGDSTCVEVRSKNGGVVVIDAGSGIRSLGNKLVAEECRQINLLFTHFHWDHVIGFPFFKPLYLPEYSINIRGCPASQGSFNDVFSHLMRHPYFPISFKQVREKVVYEEKCELLQQVEDLTITSIPLNHTDRGVGYKISNGAASFVFLTDNELLHAHPGGRKFAAYVEFCRGVDLLVHDAEYTPQEYASKRGWGHSCYEDALRLAMEAEVARFGLFHHNQDRTDDDLDAIVAACTATVAKQGGCALECFAVAQGQTFDL